MSSRKGLRLQVAMSLLVIFSVVTPIIVNWFSATGALKTSLTEEYLSNNYNYAKKITYNMQQLISMMEESLDVTSKIAGSNQLTQEKLDLLLSSNSMNFNSMFHADNNGVIEVMSPSIVIYNGGKKVQAGMKIESDAMKRSLSTREPYISEPFRATSGQLILLMTEPVFDSTGNFKGVVGGTIYLESDSALKNLLNNHEYQNDSYVYVVDHEGHIIYHPDSSRINEKITNNRVINKILNGKSGTARTTNSQGTEFFIGYAYEKQTGWGVVSQTPTTVLEKPLKNLFINMAIQSVPLLVSILVIAGFLATNLSKPLSRLASFSEAAITQKKVIPTEKLIIRTHIYEIRQLHHHIKNHIDLLNNQIQLDGLTGIANRKTFDLVIKEYVENATPFSLVLLDIDRFKKVNDTYGHLVGDEVLKYLTNIMKIYCNSEDLCFRYGGEEFGILIKGLDEEDTYEIAEALRNKIAETISPTGEAITVSVGITSLHSFDRHSKSVIERADIALYQSKSNGRNRTTLYKKENQPLPA